MENINLIFTPNVASQSTIISIEPNGIARTLRIELNYMEKSNHWYISAYDSETAKPYFLNVPLVTSNNKTNDITDLLIPFAYKQVGCLYCIPAVDNPSTEDPILSNLDEFNIIWGDNYD